MRLSSIKLAGFKSFVEPTKIPFTDQMTCVVGPNGCGKSNVIDAVRWVLGESSAKNLRGDAMTDVIFNGSTNRKPISQASVELIFDNAVGRLPGTLADRSKVSIKRLVTRDGQSLYFLNGSKCRKRDITDIFLGTGLGPRSYAIIEQGMISRLIESKPQELRVFLEEAAGVSKYKERRRETQTRIKSTRENLERLLDVRKELQAQLDRLSSQAKDARSYRQLKQQERTYKGQLAVLKWQSLYQQQQKKLLQISKVKSEIDFLNQAHSGHNDVLLALEGEVDYLADGVLAQQKSIHKTHTDLTRAEQQQIHLSDKRLALESQISACQHDEYQAQESLQRQQVDIEEHYDALRQSAELALKAQLELDDITKKTQTAVEAFERSEAHQQALQSALLAQHKAHTKLDLQKVKLNQIIKHGEDKLQVLNEQVSDLNRADPKLELDRVQKQLSLKTSEMASLQSLEQEYQSKSLNFNTQLEEAIGEYQRISVEHTNMQADIRALISVLEPEDGHDSIHLLATLRVRPDSELLVERALLGLTYLKVSSESQDDAVWPSLSEKQAGSVAELVLEGIYPSLLNHVKLLGHGEYFKPSEHWLFAVDAQGTLYGENWRAKNKNNKETGVLNQYVQLREQQQQLPILQEEMDNAEREVTRYTQYLNEHKPIQASNKELIHQVAQEVAALQTRTEILKRSLIEWQNNYDKALQKQSELVAELQSHRDELAECLTMYNAAEAQLLKYQAHIEADKQEYECTKALWQQVRTDKELAQQHIHDAKIREQEAKSHWQLAQSKVLHLQQSCEAVVSKKLAAVEELELIKQPMHDLESEIKTLLVRQSAEQSTLQALIEQQAQAKIQLQEKQTSLKGAVSEVARLRELLQKHQLEEQGLAIKAQTALEPLEALEQSLESVNATITGQMQIGSLQSSLQRVGAEIIALGAVNLAAITEFDEARERKSYLDNQLDDLTAALSTLESAIHKIDRETKVRFKETFDQINESLKELFPKVFGGGSAYLELTSNDLLDSGVSIMARPPGKKNSTIHLLSGGEKALTALSLVFSIFRLNPAPFCMLDEVDAPLDDANVGRFCRLVEEMSQTVQFIYISHNKIAMEMAGNLTGVTMAEPGVSRMVAVDIEQAVQMAQA